MNKKTMDSIKNTVKSLNTISSKFLEKIENFEKKPDEDLTMDMRIDSEGDLVLEIEGIPLFWITSDGSFCRFTEEDGLAGDLYENWIKKGCKVNSTSIEYQEHYFTISPDNPHLSIAIYRKAFFNLELLETISSEAPFYFLKQRKYQDKYRIKVW